MHNDYFTLPRVQILVNYTNLLSGEEYRTDVMVMDVEFMKSNWFYTILAPINFPDVSFPGLYKAGKESKYPYYNLKMFLDENYDK